MTTSSGWHWRGKMVRLAGTGSSKEGERVDGAYFLTVNPPPSLIFFCRLLSQGRRDSHNRG